LVPVMLRLVSLRRAARERSGFRKSPPRRDTAAATAVTQ
jgi:hypothetical protein